jgi:hypothetical protein
MPLALTDYTSPDQVRAVLGVTSKELKNTQLALDVYLSGLLVDLRSVNVGINTLYESTLLIPEVDRTDSQKAFLEAVKLYATYSVAAAITVSLSLMAVKSITDGKAGLDRFAGNPYQAVEIAVREKLAQYRSHLLDIYAQLVPDVGSASLAPLIGIRGVSPASNPVTGE